MCKSIDEGKGKKGNVEGKIGILRKLFESWLDILPQL